MAPPSPMTEVAALRRLHELMCRVNAGDDLHAVLQSVVDGVVDVTGFSVAAVSYLHPNEEFEVLAVAGNEAARTSLLGNRESLASIQQEFEIADNWGVLRFVPHERLEGEVHGWIPEFTPVDGPDAWHPEDALFAPLRSPAGELVGLLSVDLPRDGRRPGELSRTLLDMYAVQAGIAITRAKELERLREEVHLTSVVRDVAVAASGAADLAGVLAATVKPIAAGLRCDAVWVRTLDGSGAPDSGHASAYPMRAASAPAAALELAARVAQRGWQGQQAAVLAAQRPLWEVVGRRGAHSVLRSGITSAESELALDELAAVGCRSVMLAPVGAGPECLGYVLLGRTSTVADWTAEEVDAALEIGREIGRAVVRAQVFEELKRLDRDRMEMFSTVAHELKNPVTALSGHAELLASVDAIAALPAASASLASIERASARVANLVDDLLLLARSDDLHRPREWATVALADVAGNARDLVRAQADKREVTVDLRGFDDDVAVRGDAGELERVLVNLLSNAVKFSPEGSVVELALERRDRLVVLRCSDRGLGIAEGDQRRLFAEFFRSTNPEALAVPGTGLGLAIVKRIVERHHGTITVESALGVGSTFTVTLPIG